MMKRRMFLQATLAVAGVAMSGCHEETETEPTPRVIEDGAKFFPQSIASGDPKPDSVVLWARVADPAAAEGDLALELEVATDEKFEQKVTLDGKTSLPLTAELAFDHCVKVRVAGLSPATTYHYRFIYPSGEKYYGSHTGRTKTAPAKDADVPVKFAFVCCQDYNGRYYNAYKRLLAEPIDFFVHLGDYVYETDGDPSFQSIEGRKVAFTDLPGAIELTSSGGVKYHAAASLSNYRDLYKTYRSDPMLQAIHETVPMIATWDDHEYANDCHGATATYFDGKEDETDEVRRKAANQAWFEFMPVDYKDAPAFKYDATATYPDDIQIWRDFDFGKHLHLVMTDLRTYRADHLIPEDGFPGTVVVDEATLLAKFGEIPAIARPYIDIDAAEWAPYKSALAQVATASGVDPGKVTGNISVLFINAVAEELGGALPPIDEATQATLPRGVAYIDAGKLSFFSAIGSRNFTVKDGFDVLATVAYGDDPKTQEVLGPVQEKWFLDSMSAATATWKVWGNEYCLIPLQIDLTKQALPEEFKQKFYLTNDGWDGFRDKRSELIGKLSAMGNVVAVTGDIHAFFAGTPMMNDDPSKKIVELVGSSISASTFKSEIKSQVASDPVLSQLPGAAALASALEVLLLDPVNPHLGFADTARNGFVVVDVSAAEMVATYHRISETEVATNHYEDTALPSLFKVDTFKVVSGAPDLYMQKDGAWKKWNPATLAYE